MTFFIPGLYLTVSATGLRPGERYEVVWYGYRSDDDPAPVRYSFRPQPAPASGSITYRAPFWPLGFYAGDATIYSIRAIVSDPANPEVPIGPGFCQTWELYEPGAPEPCEST